MNDKSFLQALHDLQDRIYSQMQEAHYHQLLHRTTISNATSHIQDEKMRAVVTDMLITEQMIALLTLLKDLHLLNNEQYDEFTSYLWRSLVQ